MSNIYKYGRKKSTRIFKLLFQLYCTATASSSQSGKHPGLKPESTPVKNTAINQVGHTHGDTPPRRVLAQNRPERDHAQPTERGIKLNLHPTFAPVAKERGGGKQSPNSI